MTRHRRSVSRSATGIGVVFVIVLLALAPAMAGTGAATRDAHAGRAARTVGARHSACVLAGTLSKPVVGAYAGIFEMALRAVGVDVPPHAFVRWLDRLGGVAAEYCEKGAVR